MLRVRSSPPLLLHGNQPVARQQPVRVEFPLLLYSTNTATHQAPSRTCGRSFFSCAAFKNKSAVQVDNGSKSKRTRFDSSKSSVVHGQPWQAAPPAANISAAFSARMDIPLVSRSSLFLVCRRVSTRKVETGVVLGGNEVLAHARLEAQQLQTRECERAMRAFGAQI